MAEQDASPVDPRDTSRLRKLLAPVMRRNEKHTLLQAGPAEDAFLHSFITDGIVPILDEITAFAGPFVAAQQATVDAAAAAATGTALPPIGEPAAAARAFTRPEQLAALPADAFLREASLLPVDELERLAAVRENDVDVFNDEQRHALAEIIGGKQASDVFEIPCPDPMPKPGDTVEYEGRQVVMLGLSDEPDRMRVAYVDQDTRRDN